MSDLKDWFGGERSQQGPVDVTPPGVAAARDSIASYLQQYIQSGRPDYTGPRTVTQPTAVTEQLAKLHQDAIADPSGRQGYISDVLEGRYANAATNPFLESYIQAAQRSTAESAKYAFDRQLPGLFTQAGQVADPNAGSSAFTTALSKAAFDYQQNLKDIATQIAYPAYQQERGFQQQAVQLGQQEVATLIQNVGAQLIPATIEQTNIATALEIWKSTSQNIAQMMAALSGLTNIGQQATSESSKGIIPGVSGLIAALNPEPR